MVYTASSGIFIYWIVIYKTTNAAAINLREFLSSNTRKAFVLFYLQKYIPSIECFSLDLQGFA